MTPLERVLSRLKDVRKSGAGWEALCPAHDDRKRSLSVTEGEDTRALVKCHAGSACDFSAIVRAIGLGEKDLFPGRKERTLRGRIVATYDYEDEKGALLYQVVRYDPKDFRQRRPDGKGGWVWSLEGVRRVLYRLPRVLETAKTGGVVYLVEGEKDVEALERLGLVATCNAAGAGKWRLEYAEPLRGLKGAVISPDNDPPGRAHALDTARSLHTAGVPAKVLELPNLPEKGDVNDWIAAGGTKAALFELVKAAPLWEPAAEAAHAPDPTRRGLPLVRIGELLEEPDEERRWLVEGLLLAGGISLFAAKPKVGKSTLVRCLCAAVAGGERWLGAKVEQGPAIYLGFEEKRDEVKRHFRMLGVDSGAPLLVYVNLPPKDALERLRESVEDERPALVVVDGLFRLIRVLDGNAYAELYDKLAPLLALARESGAHVAMTHHEGKGAGDRDGQDGVLGSTAIVGTMDTTFALRKDRGTGRRTIQSTARYGEDLAERLLLMEEGERVLLGDTRDVQDQADAERTILEALRAQAHPILEKGTDGLEALIETRTGAFRRALRSLVGAGKVSRSGAGKRGDPYLYGLSPSTPPEIQVSGSHTYAGNPKPESFSSAPVQGESGFPVSPATGTSNGSREPESEAVEEGIL